MKLIVKEVEIYGKPEHGLIFESKEQNYQVIVPLYNITQDDRTIYNDFYDVVEAQKKAYPDKDIMYVYIVKDHKDSKVGVLAIDFPVVLEGTEGN